MTSSNTFEYLVGYLTETVGASFPEDYGADDGGVRKSKEASLCDIFERYIYRADMRRFLLSRSGVLYVYNGKYYEEVVTETFLKEVIKATMARMGVGLVYQKYSPKFIAAECLAGMENSEKAMFIPDRRYIVFSNGVFDVKEGRLNDFDMKYQTDIVMDIAYDASAVYALWEQKVAEIIPIEAHREAFRMFCGMLLINRQEIKFEYVCFLLGPGSNGKSVIASTIAAVFGSRYFAKFSPDQLLKSSDKMFNLASLEGMIANFTDDLDKEDISSKGFKSFASGQEFEARHPFGRKVFKVKAPLMLCCANQMPPTTDDSWGYHRRILPIHSSLKVWGEEDKDPYLESKLSTPRARAAIFNWIYEGYKNIIANGGNIKLGKEVVDAQMELRDDSNSARRWLRDCELVYVDPNGREDKRWKLFKEWHRMYREYCQENGERYPQTSKSLGKLFREKGYATRKDASGVWYCIGQMGVDTLPNRDCVSYDVPTDEEELPF